MRARTQTELEATFRDYTDPSYADALEHTEQGLGWDPVASAAATLSRTARALEQNSEAFYLLPHSRQLAPSATGAQYAEGMALVFRMGSAAAALTLPAGEVLKAGLRDSRGTWRASYDHALRDPVTFEVGELGPLEVRVRALRPGEHGNLGSGALVGFRDPALEHVRLLQTDPLTGGRHATLDAIGAERGVPRGPAETDLDYAYRVSVLPDVVSPAALDRICAQMLSPLGIAYRIYETQIDLPGFVLDETPLDGASLVPGEPFLGQVMLSETASRRYFVVLVEPRPDLDVGGLPLDAINAGINAFDVATMPAASSSAPYRNALRTLYQSVDAARLEGVGWQLVIGPLEA